MIFTTFYSGNLTEVSQKLVSRSFTTWDIRAAILSDLACRVLCGEPWFFSFLKTEAPKVVDILGPIVAKCCKFGDLKWGSKFSGEPNTDIGFHAYHGMENMTCGSLEAFSNMKQMWKCGNLSSFQFQHISTYFNITTASQAVRQLCTAGSSLCRTGRSDLPVSPARENLRR